MKTSNLVPFRSWLADMALDRVTGWRYRKQGLVRTCSIHGRIYIHADEIARFEARAAAGEFAKGCGGASKSD